MTEKSEHETIEYVRTLQSRMLRQSIDHLPGAVDGRTAMIVVKNGLLKETPESQIPSDIVEVIEDARHPRRWPGSSRPFIVFSEGERRRGLIELTTVLLNPESRLRNAAIAELDRQVATHSKTGLFLSPSTRLRLDTLREVISGDGLRDSLSASIEIADLLRDDFFYQLAGIRQCVDLQLDSELPDLFTQVLAPSDRTIRFLLELPVWSPQRQEEAIEKLRSDIIECATDFGELLRQYYRLFGHLPLAEMNSAAGVVSEWVDLHGLPDDPWEVIWDWANGNGSPLACYHACQLLCRNPSWVPEKLRQQFLRTIAGVVLGAVNDERWQRRCNLARHYCKHLEALSPGADGERVAAYAWWLAEYLGDMIDRFPNHSRSVCATILAEAFQISDEVWTVARPPTSVSSLRYATLFSRSIWATAILCELSEPELLSWLGGDSRESEVFEEALCKLPFNAVGWRGVGAMVYCFDGSTKALENRLAGVRRESTDPSLKQIQSTLAKARSDGGLARLIEELPKANHSVALIVSHELRLRAMCSEPPCETLFELFSDSDWRNGVLVECDEDVVELVCSAAIEVALHDKKRDWRTYLPHLFALACEDASTETKKRHLFACTIVASLSTDSASAVERLLHGACRRDYDDFVTKWRERIDNLKPVAPAWISAKLRGMKAVLYVGG